jgi:carboxyl-terminal processing protease
MVEFADEKADALLVDLRDGFGGANPYYLNILSENPRLRTVPKYFLINDGVRSGKEWLCAIIKKEKIGTLIGTRTAGTFVGGHSLMRQRTDSEPVHRALRGAAD